MKTDELINLAYNSINSCNMTPFSKNFYKIYFIKTLLNSDYYKNKYNHYTTYIFERNNSFYLYFQANAYGRDFCINEHLDRLVYKKEKRAYIIEKIYIKNDLFNTIYDIYNQLSTMKDYSIFCSFYIDNLKEIEKLSTLYFSIHLFPSSLRSFIFSMFNTDIYKDSVYVDKYQAFLHFRKNTIRCSSQWNYAIPRLLKHLKLLVEHKLCKIDNKSTNSFDNFIEKKTNELPVIKTNIFYYYKIKSKKNRKSDFLIYNKCKFQNIINKHFSFINNKKNALEILEISDEIKTFRTGRNKESDEFIGLDFLSSASLSKEEDTHVIVCHQNGVVAGILSFSIKRKIVYIETICVKHNFRKQKIPLLLYEKFINFIIEVNNGYSIKSYFYTNEGEQKLLKTKLFIYEKYKDKINFIDNIFL